MQLNTPPPGADRAAELIPAVLRPAAARSLVPHPGANDALGAMLRGSRSWETVHTSVSRTVTVTSWLLLCLDIVAFFVTRAFADDTGFFAAIVTWKHNPVAPLLCSVFATSLMVMVAAMTRGLRSADLGWLRVWVCAVAASVIAVAPMLIALGALLLMVAFGIAVVVGIAMAALD